MMKTKKPHKERICILGAGKEGKSVRAFLKHDARYRNARVTVRDQKQGKDYLRGLHDFDIIFRSPGIPYLTPEIQAAKKQGVRISSATKLFFELLHPQSSVVSRRLSVISHKSPTIIGITGSKGKGTTATLLYQILKNAKKKVVLAGNIGLPMLDVLQKAQRAQYVILELSSFQLQDLTVSPDIAVVLDIFPEHLDHHKNAQEYYRAKSSIARFQKSEDSVFYFSNNKRSQRIATPGKGKKIGVTPKENSARKNFEMARAVATHLKIAQTTIDKTVSSFRGLEHRLELAHSIPIQQTHYKNTSRIYFYNDSAATNPEATAAAIRTFDAPLVLIAGGKDKGLDYSTLGKTILVSKNLQLVVLFGENKEKIRLAIRDEFNKSKKPITAPHMTTVENLSDATEHAYAFAKSLVASGYWLNPVILFSPASASFDQFKDYADRGRQFKKIVKKLA